MTFMSKVRSSRHGDTVDEAVENGRDALKATVATLKARKLPVPAPNSGGVAFGKFVARVPKTVQAQLAVRARTEGVSLNALVPPSSPRGLAVLMARRGGKVLPDSSVRRVCLGQSAYVRR